jgi:hypothetical protein
MAARGSLQMPSRQGSASPDGGAHGHTPGPTCPCAMHLRVNAGPGERGPIHRDIMRARLPAHTHTMAALHSSSQRCAPCFDQATPPLQPGHRWLQDPPQAVHPQQPRPPIAPPLPHKCTCNPRVAARVPSTATADSMLPNVNWNWRIVATAGPSDGVQAMAYHSTRNGASTRTVSALNTNASACLRAAKYATNPLVFFCSKLENVQGRPPP